MDPLHGYSSCEVADALVKLGITNGGYIPDIKQYSPYPDESATRVCGPAYTVLMVEAADKESPKPSKHFVDASPAGSIVVIQSPPVKSAVWGGLMTAGAQARGVVAVVISGRCRDLAEHRAANFPVYTRGQSILGQSTFTRPSALNVPVVIESDKAGSFPSVTVHPGDIVLADLDGVVCVPVEFVSKVVEMCKVAREIDSHCMEDIKNGKGVQETFAKWRGK